MSQDKKNVAEPLIFFIAFFVLVLFFDYLIYNRLINPSPSEKTFFTIVQQFKVVNDKGIFFRFAYIVLLAAYCWLSPSSKLAKGMNEDDKRNYAILACLFSIVVILGYIGFVIYDVFIFPLIFFAQIYILAKALSTTRQQFVDEGIFGINQSEEGKCVFKIKLADTEKFEFLVIPNANYGMIVDGGTGAGKTASIIKPLIHQAALTGYAGLIYDYNGNPLEDTCPVLTKAAMLGNQDGMALARKSKTEFKTRLVFINFVDLQRTARTNPINPKYISSKLDIVNISTSLMKNLEPSWKEKMDFWAQNAVQIFTAAIRTLHKRYPEYCTLPHAVALVLSPHERFLKFVATDPDVCRDFMPVYSAFIAKAEGQIAGAIASAQSPLTKLNNPEIFWVLSKDEIDLDITNPDNPTLLCLGNDPKLSTALSAAISAIVLVCMSNMNKPGKVKSIFCFDEIPTINLYKVDEFIAVCRKYNVCSIFGLQTHEQFVRDYGDKSANTIRNTLGNYLLGNTGDLNTAKYLTDMLGTVKKADTSYSESETSLSTSEKLQNEKALQPRDIMSQPIGHFTGKIVGGKPAFFTTQFDWYRDEKREPIIEPFANPYANIGGLSKEKADEYFFKDVQINYDTIYADIDKILGDNNKQENLDYFFKQLTDCMVGQSDDFKKSCLTNLAQALKIKN